jgi:NADH:ubiquinone oxidoreductase subunit F (NADH-binding)
MNILAGPKGMPSILLARAGRYDPTGPLAQAEEAGAWAAWKKTVPRLSPQAVIRQVGEARLRGRGGAGYPTAEKWRAAAAAEGHERYVVANGIEADPGAQLDRLLMEQDPHAVLEGTALAAYAIGATRAYVAVHERMTLARQRLAAALQAAEEAGYIGINALGSGLDISLELVALPGGLVVGEETTLIRTIENKRAQPDQRPPYPANDGVWGRPTVVNNVETLSLVPWIAANGGADFAAIGDDDFPGTTLIQLIGAVKRPGIVEAPLGMSLRRLLELAGGPADEAPLKAVLVGGPAGGFLPPGELDMLYTPTALAAAGATWGSGTILAIDQRTCLVDMATTLARYLSDEACGKTIPCRIGLRRLYEIGRRATTGLARPIDGEVLQQLAADISDAALCSLERLATNPFLSGMRYFADEFDQHFTHGKCPAGVCATMPTTVQAVSA